MISHSASPLRQNDVPSNPGEIQHKYSANSAMWYTQVELNSFDVIRFPEVSKQSKAAMQWVFFKHALKNRIGAYSEMILKLQSFNNKKSVNMGDIVGVFMLMLLDA